MIFISWTDVAPEGSEREMFSCCLLMMNTSSDTRHESWPSPHTMCHMLIPTMVFSSRWYPKMVSSVVIGVPGRRLCRQNTLIQRQSIWIWRTFGWNSRSWKVWVNKFVITSRMSSFSQNIIHSYTKRSETLCLCGLWRCMMGQISYTNHTLSYTIALFWGNRIRPFRQHFPATDNVLGRNRLSSRCFKALFKMVQGRGQSMNRQWASIAQTLVQKLGNRCSSCYTIFGATEKWGLWIVEVVSWRNSLCRHDVG